MGLALHEPRALQVVDDRGQVGRVHAEEPSQLAHRHRPPAIRRNALIVPKLTPVCSLTSRRRWLSSTRAAIACHASRAERS